jgi:predicted TIM-barrel fold metal-dependent hydrolase
MTNRRQFLAAAAAAPFLTSAPLPHRIIDAHVHFYDPSRPQGVPWPPKTDEVLYKTTLPDRFRKIVTPLGVTGTVVIEASALFEDNQWVLDLAKDNPVIVGFVGHLEPGKPEFKDHLARFHKNPLFRGIRLGERPLGAGVLEAPFMADMKRMADANLELDVIGGPGIFAHTVRLTDQVPNLRIVIDHLPFDAQANDAFRELRSKPNVYAKVSGVLRKSGGRVPTDLAFYQKSLDELWNNFGEDRLVYASNWPVSDLLAAYKNVLELVRAYFATKGPEATEKFFWKNSKIAYRWVDGTAKA